jgi:hypothetical protein
MKQIFAILAIGCLLTIPAVGQDLDQARLETPNAYNSLGVQPAATPFSLLDFSRIKWSNSYSVSFFSGGNQSGSVGLATTSLFYEFTDRLSLQVNLGILHNPGAIWGDKNNNDATLLPGFRLDYRPADNVFMTVEFQRIDGRAYPYGFSRYDRYWPY